MDLWSWRTGEYEFFIQNESITEGKSDSKFDLIDSVPNKELKNEISNLIKLSDNLKKTQKNKGNLYEIIRITEKIGDLYCKIFDFNKGKEFLLNALHYYKKKISIKNGNIFFNLAICEYQLSNNEEAEKYYKAALPLYREVGAKLGEANVYSNLGELEFKNKPDKTIILFKQAYKLYVELEDAYSIKNLENLSVEYFKKNIFDNAF